MPLVPKLKGVLNDELNRIAETTSFGGNKLLNGTHGTKSFQIGADNGEAVMLQLKDMRSDDSPRATF